MGGQIGNKGGGRQTDAEIIRKYVNAELANRIANKELKRIDEKESATMEELKTVVMPIALKGMTEKKEFSGNLSVNIDKDIAEAYALDTITKIDSEGQTQI